MIAVLWAPYLEPTISVDSSPARVAITWNAYRPPPRNIWYEPLGENVFQARLYPSGIVELAYQSVPERDGIVGLFHGTSADGQSLDKVDDEVGEVANAMVDLTSIEFIDTGSAVLARIGVAGDVPAQVLDGLLGYRIFLEFGGANCAVELRVGANGRRGYKWCSSAPSAVGFRVREATIEIPISKTLFAGADHFSWSADAVWWGRDVFDQMLETRRVDLVELDYDLGTMSGPVAGNTFEVFHYPSFHKRSNKVMSFIYGQASAGDEIAVPFTDFRIDDLFSTGSGSGPINEPVEGIGPLQASPKPGEQFGSDRLLVTMVPLFIGAPALDEDGVDPFYGEFRNFPYAIRWIAHEAVQRWSAHLAFRNPQSGTIELLTDDRCRCRWSRWLHAPAVLPVGPYYSDHRSIETEASVMGGSVWRENGDGTFTSGYSDDPMPSGLSALDLYVMGMIAPSQVPDTFILRNVQETGTWNQVRATKVPVRIDHIQEAMGLRLPDASVSRKEFRLGVYLLHENGRPPQSPALERAQAVTAEVAEYFSMATGGLMRVLPTVTATE